MMKKLITSSLLLCSMMFFVAGSAFAIKPGETVNPNGFPSGEHFNLNIHGKDPLGFVCPDKTTQYGIESYWKPILDEYGEPTGEYKLDTSIFIPEYTVETQTIEMQSGKKGGKPKGVTLPTNQLIVTDACTEGIDDSSASFQLPPCDAGYSVYARVLGKPSEKDQTREITLSAGDLIKAEDEFGNDLLYIGTLTSNGYTKPDGSAVFTRKKGKSVAVPITDLFLFTGSICYLNEPVPWDPCNLDPNDPGAVDPDDCRNSEETLCCEPVLVEGVPTGEYINCDLKELVQDESGFCPEGQEEVTAYCQYYEDEWIFNIADLVEYYFGVANDGVKLIQIRFYPN